MLHEGNKLADGMRRLRYSDSKCNIESTSYTRMFSGRPEELKFDAKFRTDAIELKSNSMVSTLAVGFSLTMASWTFLPVATFLTAITTRTPRNARTRAVSLPMPLDAPVLMQKTL